MKTLLKPTDVILSLLLLVSIAGCGSLSASQSQTLTASGVIEATQITVSPELGGSVIEILVNEGDPVKAGAVLFRMDDSLLQAQRKLAAATLDSARASKQIAAAALAAAQAQYDLARMAAHVEEQPARAANWQTATTKEFDQPNWFFNHDEQLAAAQAGVEAARQSLDEARAHAVAIEKQAASADFLAAEEKLAEARIALQAANDVLARAKKGDGTDLQQAAQDAYDSAKQDLDNAQKDYDDLFTTDAAKDVLKVRARLAIARERYDTALDQLYALQTGDQSPRVTAAQKALEQAEAVAAQADSAIAQAEAQLGLVDAQIQKLTVRAPIDGVVLTRSVQKGEVLQPGSAAMTIAQLDKLTVTVYIPEDRYGEINLGGHASLKGDSFPGETFDAVVSRIADQAEYTPRNVQTTEGRQTTVYAIELSVANPDGKLKPGMPVDVEFQK